jgi:hypothetical protein
MLVVDLWLSLVFLLSLERRRALPIILSATTGRQRGGTGQISSHRCGLSVVSMLGSSSSLLNIQSSRLRQQMDFTTTLQRQWDIDGSDHVIRIQHLVKWLKSRLQLCEIEKGIPDNCATTDNLNGYLVLKAMENLNNYFYVQDRTGEKAYTLLTNEIPSIRKDLKPSKTQESFKEPEPKKWVQMGAKVLGSIPEVGVYIGGAITALGEIYISEPLKNVDTDLSNVQNNFKNIILALDKRLQATFQAAFNGDPTAAGGAIAVLKGGAFLRSFSVLSS